MTDFEQMMVLVIALTMFLICALYGMYELGSFQDYDEYMEKLERRYLKRQARSAKRKALKNALVL